MRALMFLRSSQADRDGVQSQRGLDRALPAGPTAWDVLVEEAGTAIGGALTSDFFGRSRPGSRAGRALFR